MNSEGITCVGGWVEGGSGCGLPDSCLLAGFSYTMSSKSEKKRRGSGRASGGQGSAWRQAAPAVLTSQAAEAPPAASELEPQSEPLKEEPGGYMLERSLGAECVYLRRVSAEEQVPLLIAKWQGFSKISGLPLGPFFVFSSWPALMLVLSVLRFPPNAPRGHQPILNLSLFFLISSVPGCSYPAEGFDHFPFPIFTLGGKTNNVFSH